ncbi:hypothetical protein HDU76_010105 [Blyttiomyces sp. JEL0837]|nr:hypothetical protein HDU76_010105 [Blyttiomyces sp. JEL0837]
MILNKPSDTEAALQAYREASRFEREGSLGKALMKYREATKLCLDIDRIAREHLKVSAAALDTRDDTGTDSFQTFYSFKHHVDDDHHHRSAFSEEVAASRPWYTPMRADRPILLALLPSEVVVQVIKWAIILDVSALVPISLTCKSLYLETYSQTLWKGVVQKYHVCAPGFTSLVEEVKLYKEDWLLMFLTKHRIRFDGIYISRVNYARQGYAESLHNPFMIVTYFRYLRFLPSGTVISWTTSLEPQVAVKDIQPDMKPVKGMSRGTFTLNGDKVILKTQDPENRKNTFHWTLGISSTRRGRQNKLQWQEYFYERERDHMRTDVTSSQLKPFIFSKVRSFLPPHF